MAHLWVWYWSLVHCINENRPSSRSKRCFKHCFIGDQLLGKTNSSSALEEWLRYREKWLCLFTSGVASKWAVDRSGVRVSFLYAQFETSVLRAFALLKMFSKHYPYLGHLLLLHFVLFEQLGCPLGTCWLSLSFTAWIALLCSAFNANCVPLLIYASQWLSKINLHFFASPMCSSTKFAE